MAALNCFYKTLLLFSLHLVSTNSDLKKYAAKKATTYIYYQIRLVTSHATNQDMLLYRKPRLWGCYYSRHVTNQDVLVLATIRLHKIGTWLLGKLTICIVAMEIKIIDSYDLSFFKHNVLSYSVLYHSNTKVCHQARVSDFLYTKH